MRVQHEVRDVDRKDLQRWEGNEINEIRHSGMQTVCVMVVLVKFVKCTRFFKD